MPDLSQAVSALAELAPVLLVVTDTVLADGTVLDVMAARRGAAAFAPVLVVAATDAIELAVEAMRRGAVAFLTKPISPAMVAKAVERALAPAPSVPGRTGEGVGVRSTPFLGSSRLIRELADEVGRVSGSDAPLLIHGETGTGKGVLARWIHDDGQRARGPFVDVNCASLSRDLFESELYGFEKGAFTSAAATKIGLIEAANRGTMFLDEIGDLDVSVQPRLLKVIEDKRFRRLGSVREQQSDVRFIAASNHDLPELVREKRFRQDLLYRINTLVLTCPPLRQRPEDIPAIATRLLEAAATDLRRAPLVIAPDAMAVLMAHAWRGNIRELRHVIERAALVCADGTIAAADLRLGPDAAGADPASRDDDALTLEVIQLRHIKVALEAEGWNVERAAQRLGIPRSTLYQKIKTHQICASR